MVSPLAAIILVLQDHKLTKLIFSFLDKKSLLRLQATNKLLKHLVESTSNSKQKLCLSPQCSEIIKNDPEHARGFHHVKPNSFLYHIKVSRDDESDEEEKRWSIVERLPEPRKLVVSADSSLWWSKEGVLFFLFVPQGLKTVDGDPIPSWRNMYLTKTPVTHVRIFYPCKRAIAIGKIENCRTAHNIVTNTGGIKISDVIDAIIEYADTQYLKMAPYAVQVIQYKDGFDAARKQYKHRLWEHYSDWKRELGFVQSADSVDQ